MAPPVSLEPLLRSSSLIQFHVACAFLGLVVGAVHLFRKKGDRLHRVIGYVWVGLMAFVALSSLFIWTIRTFWLFSPIHIVSVFTLVMLWRAVQMARRHDIRGHQRTMKMLYLLALVVTGLFTFLPGRRMYGVVFGADGATGAEIAVFAAAIVSIAGAATVIVLWRKTRRGRAFIATH